MNKKSSKVVLIMLGTFGLCLLFGLFAGKDALAIVGTIGFFLAIILFFIGLGMIIFHRTKKSQKV